ncbi:hypothetical protein KAJ27_11540 [bacterium]|nr:hypothetical protein [bacterium]
MSEKQFKKLNLLTILFTIIKKTGFILGAVLLHFLLLFFRIYPYYSIIVIVILGIVFLTNNLTIKKVLIYAIGLIFVNLHLNEIMRFSIFNHNYLILLLMFSFLLDTENLTQKKILLFTNLVLIFFLLSGPTYFILLYSSLLWILLRFMEIVCIGEKKILPVIKNSLLYILILTFIINSTVLLNKGKCRIGFDTGHKNIESSNAEFKGKFDIENLTGHGGLKKYLNSFENIEIIQNNTFSKKLDESDIIFIIMPTVPFNISEKTAFLKFIKSGGKAVLISEHDNMENSGSVLNDLLKDTGISFNNDIVWINDKIKNLRFSFNSLFFRNQIHYKTGCSIKGLPKNLIFDKKNTPLAGELRLGKGKIFCFGDSSLFQNTTFYYHYDFIKDLIKHLHYSKKMNPMIFLPLILIFILQFFWLYAKGYSFYNAFASVTYYMEYIITVVLILSFISGSFLFSNNDSMFTSSHKYIAYDFSRNSKRVTAMETDNLVNNNLDSIISFTTVTEFLPIVKNNFQDILNMQKSIKGIFSIAPEIPYTDNEISEINTYIEGGGNFFLISGVDTIDNMNSLLTGFGIKFNNRPILWGDAGIKETKLISKIELGKVAISCNDSEDQYFFNPCSITGVEPLFIIENNIVAGMKKIGKGKFYIFCDDSFFSNGLTASDNKCNDIYKVNYFYDLIETKKKRKIN